MSITERMPAIYIDPTRPNNRGDGSTLGTAWRDLEELSRRLGRGTAKFRQSSVITIAGTPPTTDVLSLQLATSPNASIRVEGTPTVAGSGTFTAVQGINRATQTMQNVTDSSQDFSSHLHQMIVIVGGARAGAYTSIAKNLNSPTSSNVRTGRWIIPDRTNPFNSTTVVPQIGDAYNILTFPTVKLGTVRVESANATPSTNYLNIHNIELDQGLSSARSFECALRVFVTACATRTTTWGDVIVNFAGCRIANSSISSGTTFYASSAVLYACVIERAPALSRADLIFDRDTLLQGDLGTHISIGPNDSVDIGTACMFDNDHSDSIQVEGTLRSYAISDGVDLLWGTGNSKLYVQSEGKILYETKPTINSGQGVGNELRVGQYELTWADVPFHDNDRGGTVAVMKSHL